MFPFHENGKGIMDSSNRIYPKKLSFGREAAEETMDFRYILHLGQPIRKDIESSLNRSAVIHK